MPLLAKAWSIWAVLLNIKRDFTIAMNTDDRQMSAAWTQSITHAAWLPSCTGMEGNSRNES